MRWKLLSIASLSAAAISAGAILGFGLPLYSNTSRPPQRLALLAAILIPLAVTAAAGIFVYRHTARRRKLQVLVTVLGTLLLALAAVFVSVLVRKV